MLFFKNVRRDGGVRIGVEMDGERLFHSYVDGPEVESVGDENPALDWYLDIGFEGKAVPSDPDKVKKWLIRFTKRPTTTRRLAPRGMIWNTP